MFTVFNSSSSMLDNIINGPKMVDPHSSGTRTLSTKMVDFQNLVTLGQLLADKRNVIRSRSNNSSIEAAEKTVQTVYKTLSTHVYINHVKNPATTAAATAAAAASNRGEHSSWWNMKYPNKSPKATLDPRSVQHDTPDSADVYIASNTNPLESHDYFPDLRLVLKNVLVLFISFFKRYEELIAHKLATSHDADDLIRALKDLMLLFNISILNKLVEIFKMLNPNLSLTTEKDICGVLTC